MSIVTKMDNAGDNGDGWRLLKQLDNHFWFCLGAGGNGCGSGAPTTVVSSTTVAPDTWYCVAGTRSANAGISIYVDGVLEDAMPPATHTDTDAANVVIGDYPRSGGNSYMYGAIDEVQFYNRALGADEVASTCSTLSANVPETSVVVLVPLTGAAVLGAIVVVRRRKRMGRAA